MRLCTMRHCLTRIPGQRLFCGRHWSMVPAELQEEIAVTLSSGDTDGLTALLAKTKNIVRVLERKNPSDY